MYKLQRAQVRAAKQKQAALALLERVNHQTIDYQPIELLSFHIVKTILITPITLPRTKEWQRWVPFIKLCLG